MQREGQKGIGLVREKAETTPLERVSTIDIAAVGTTVASIGSYSPEKVTQLFATGVKPESGQTGVTFQKFGWSKRASSDAKRTLTQRRGRTIADLFLVVSTPDTAGELFAIFASDSWTEIADGAVSDNAAPHYWTTDPAIGAAYESLGAGPSNQPALQQFRSANFPNSCLFDEAGQATPSANAGFTCAEIPAEAVSVLIFSMPKGLAKNHAACQARAEEMIASMRTAGKDCPIFDAAGTMYYPVFKPQAELAALAAARDRQKKWPTTAAWDERAGQEQRLSFDRAAWTTAVTTLRQQAEQLFTTTPPSSPEAIHQVVRDTILACATPDFEQKLTASVGTWEGYSLGQHIAMVTERYLRFLSQASLPASVSSEMMLTLLFLHDIGKADSQAIKRDNTLQHEFTGVIADSFLHELNFSDQERQAMVALIDTECIGRFLVRTRDTELGSLTTDEKSQAFFKEIYQRIATGAEQANMSVSEFFNWMKSYWKADFSAYTVDAGGKKAMDKHLSFNHETRTLQLSSAYEERLSLLERYIQEHPPEAK